MTPNQERLLRFVQEQIEPGTWTHLGDDARPDGLRLAELGFVEVNEAEDKYRIPVNTGPPPSPPDLSPQDQELLLTGEITKVEQLGDEWRDDHIDCVAVRVHVGGRQIDCSLWWCGPTIIGAIKYADESPRAMADVLRELRNHVRNDIDCAEEE